MLMTVALAAVETEAKGNKWCKLVATFNRGASPLELPASCQVAIVSGGSFIQLSVAMEKAPGVVGVIRGYTGGFTRKPTYEAVCSGKTGHAEAVMVAFDTSATSYEKVLHHWLDSHGTSADSALMAVIGDENYFGPQYRSAVYFRTIVERLAFLRVMKRATAKNNGTAPMTRAFRFDGRFTPENATAEDLVVVRKSVAAEAKANKYTRKTKDASLVAKVVEEQAIGGDDKIAKEFDKLDKEGKLAGIALVAEGKKEPAAAKPAAKKKPVAAEKAANTTVVDKSVDKANAKPAEQPAEKTAEKAAEQPAEEKPSATDKAAKPQQQANGASNTTAAAAETVAEQTITPPPPKQSEAAKQAEESA
jgi:peptide methionine sulfoxide reductase MsrA